MRESKWKLAQNCCPGVLGNQPSDGTGVIVEVINAVLSRVSDLGTPLNALESFVSRSNLCDKKWTNKRIDLCAVDRLGFTFVSNFVERKVPGRWNWNFAVWWLRRDKNSGTYPARRWKDVTSRWTQREIDSGRHFLRFDMQTHWIWVRYEKANNWKHSMRANGTQRWVNWTGKFE